MPRCAWVASLAIGCGHPAPAPALAPGHSHVFRGDAGLAADGGPVALDDDLPRLADRAIHLYQDWRKALADAGDDCAAATTKIIAVADAYADVIAANRRVLHAGHDKVVRLRAALGDALDDDGQAIVHSPTLAKCGADPAFARALERIGGES